MEFKVGEEALAANPMLPHYNEVGRVINVDTAKALYCLEFDDGRIHWYSGADLCPVG